MLEKIRKMSWVEWGVVVAAATSLLLLPTVINDLVGYREDIGSQPFFSPWMHADAVETKIAIEEFESREPPGRSFPMHRLMALAGTVLFYVIGPGLLILCGVGLPSDGDGVPVSFQAGVALMVAGIVNLGMMSVLPRQAERQARKENAHQKMQDQMSREVFEIAHAAYQYYVLPDSLGGGGGSFTGITLGDIDGELKFQPGAYQLRVKSDTLLKIEGTRPSPYPTGEKDSIRVVGQSRPSSVVDIEYPSE